MVGFRATPKDARGDVRLDRNGGERGKDIMSCLFQSGFWLVGAMLSADDDVKNSRGLDVL